MAGIRNNSDTRPCICCKKNKKEDSYYASKSTMFKGFERLPICKDCIDDEFEILLNRYSFDVEKSVYYLCMKLDYSFNYNALDAAKKQTEKTGTSIHRTYLQKINSLGGTNGYGSTFIDSDNCKMDIHMDNINNQEYSSEFELTNDIILYWGKGKSTWEYDYLEEQIYKIKSSFECPDYGMEMLMRDICFINLDIEKVRQGEKGDVSKLIETRSKLMNDAKMKPIQATGAEANEQITFGTLIKKWETEKPVPISLEDEMKKYIDTYMVGHLAKMQGLNCDLVDNYEESLKEFTIDFEELNNEDDE